VRELVNVTQDQSLLDPLRLRHGDARDRAHQQRAGTLDGASSEEALIFFAQKKTAYQFAFGSPAGKAVLEDLGTFCRARETCVVPGDRDRTYVLEGRREVHLRIQDFLERTPEELVAMYTLNPKEATDEQATGQAE
jgi:hypothetical protein